MKKQTKFSLVLLLTCLVVSTICTAESNRYAVSTVWPKGKGLSFFIVSDPGRNGLDMQKIVAQRIGDLAQIIEPKFIASTGDIVHFKGVESINDPLWISNFGSII